MVVIREAKPEDAEALILCIRAYLSNNFIPITPAEFHPSTQEEELWIQTFHAQPSSLLLVAEVGSTIVGNIDLTAHPRLMLKHTAVVGMGVHPDWQGKGIGKQLLASALNWADDHTDLDILWLQVFGDNEKAIQLYYKSGFTETGRQPDFIRKPDGTCVDQVTMMRKHPMV